MASIFDKEVEKYFGINCGVDRNEIRCYSAVRLKSTSMESTSAMKRPASACAVLSPERKTPYKSESNKLQKTPIKSSVSLVKKKATPRKTPSSIARTPKTPRDSDRFIPPRGSMNFSSSHHKIMQMTNNENEMVANQNKNKTFEQGMTENLNKILGDSNNRILRCQSKVKTPIKGDCSMSITSQSVKKKSRKIPLISERVLDAPNYVDDYYLNLLHWSPCEDLLAVALDHSVYIWTPATGDINHLCELEGPESYVTSIQWVEQGNHLAVGTVNGIVELWDTEQKKRLRQMTGHAARVGCLSWNSHILSSGSRSGSIHNHDVRVAQHHISSFLSHSQEVCGIQWSPGGRYLASGSNNNKVIVWDYNQVHQSHNTLNEPIHCFTGHRAAVKALAWCPWQHHILASGGGAADKCIRFWNVNSGNCLNKIETESQVSSLLWNESYKEIISGHGQPNNQLSVWQFPSMTKKADLLGHTGRILQLTLSTDKTHVMSSAADETLRLWHCFELSNDKKHKKSQMNAGSILSLTNIR